MQQFELTHEYLDQLEEWIDAGNKTEIQKAVDNLHPADIAEILKELNNERAQFVFLLLNNEKASDVLAEIDEEERAQFLESIPAETIARRFIDNMDSDDAADVVLFPVDRRLGEDYMRGPRQFIETIRTGMFVPMHFGEDYEGGNAFRPIAEERGCRFCAIGHRGERFDLSVGGQTKTVSTI